MSGIERTRPAVSRIDREYDHFLLAHDGALTLHNASRTVAYPLPLDRARLGDLTVSRGYYRATDGREHELRWPYGYDTSNRGPIRPTPATGLVLGHHHSDWLGVVNALRSAKDDREGLRLLVLMTRAAIDEPGVLACTWAERACIILRRANRYVDEVAVIELAITGQDPRDSEILRERLVKARALAAKAGQHISGSIICGDTSLYSPTRDGIGGVVKSPRRALSE